MNQAAEYFSFLVFSKIISIGIYQDMTHFLTGDEAIENYRITEILYNRCRLVKEGIIQIFKNFCNLY